MLAEDMGRFYTDPLGYVRYAFEWGEGELRGWDGPDEWQAEFLAELGEQVRARGFNGIDPVDPIRMARASGHGIGKSALVAWVILWIMSTRPYARGVVTANTAAQLRTKTWAELAKWKRRCITGHWFDMTTSGNNLSLFHVQHPQDWRVDAQTCKEENSEAFAGLHAASSTPFYIFDEASAVPDKISEVAQGGLTDGEPMFFQFGNPTRNSGFFHECVFGRFRHRWLAKSIDSRTCRTPNKRLIAEWIEDYGLDSDFVKVRVRGLPPDASSLQFIARSLIANARKRPSFVEDFQPIVVGVDVARFGDDRSVIYTRRGRDAKTWPAKVFRGIDTMQLAAKVAEHVHELGDIQRVGAVFIDGVGVGGGVVDRCRQLNVPNVIEVNGGAKANSGAYANKRTEMYGELRAWLAGAAVLDDENLETELVAVEYGITRDNRLQLEPKDAMKDRLGESPDLADALALTFAEPVGPLAVKHPHESAPGHLHQSEYDPYASGDSQSSGPYASRVAWPLRSTTRSPARASRRCPRRRARRRRFTTFSAPASPQPRRAGPASPRRPTCARRPRRPPPRASTLSKA